jgi:hypothetical protein
MGAAVMKNSILPCICLYVAKLNLLSVPLHIGTSLCTLADFGGRTLECMTRRPPKASAMATQTRQDARCGRGLVSGYPLVARWR